MQNSIKLSGRISKNVKVSENGKSARFSIYRVIQNPDPQDRPDVCFTEFTCFGKNVEFIQALPHKTLIDISGFMSFYTNEEEKSFQSFVADEIIVRS